MTILILIQCPICVAVEIEKTLLYINIQYILFIYLFILIFDFCGLNQFQFSLFFTFKTVFRQDINHISKSLLYIINFFLTQENKNQIGLNKWLILE